MVALAFLLPSCGDEAITESEAPDLPLPALTDEQKVQRMQLCMSEIEQWRAEGVWIHGGVQPAVNREAWSSLSESEKVQIASIAACIQSSGAFTPQTVQIVSEGFKNPIEEIESENRLFASEF